MAWRSLRSRAPSGSSSSRALGWLTRARASATRCCWPPDSSRGRRCSRPVRSTISSISPTWRVILVLGHALAAQPERHVLEHAHVREQRVGLEHHVHVALVRRGRGDVPAVQPDGAAGGLLEARDHPHRGGLAAPRRAEHGEELTLADGQVDAADGGDHLAPGVELLGHPVEPDGRHAGRRRLRRADRRPARRGRVSVGHTRCRSYQEQSLVSGSWVTRSQLFGIGRARHRAQAGQRATYQVKSAPMRQVDPILADEMSPKSTESVAANLNRNRFGLQPVTAGVTRPGNSSRA